VKSVQKKQRKKTTRIYQRGFLIRVEACLAAVCPRWVSHFKTSADERL
jgi:hypothetical protein